MKFWETLSAAASTTAAKWILKISTSEVLAEVFRQPAFEDIFDIFSSFMGGGSRSSAGAQRQTPRGSDVTCSVNVSFLEAALGASKEIKLNRLERCPDCNGTGAKDSSSVKECDECHGTGRVQYVRDSFSADR